MDSIRGTLLITTDNHFDFSLKNVYSNALIMGQDIQADLKAKMCSIFEDLNSLLVVGLLF